MAEDWVRMTFSNDPTIIDPITDIMLRSHQICVDYMTPLGLHHIMAEGHHYGPGPWVDGLSRADWTSVYYHKADSTGIGFDRTINGSDAVATYFPPLRDIFANRNSCPTKFLLWFHHLAWKDKMPSGRPLWEELCFQYYQGAEEALALGETWDMLEQQIDSSRFQHVKMLLQIQAKEAKWWRDACILYFQQFSKMPIPPSLIPPDNDLEYYKNISHPYAPGIKPKW